MLNPENISSTVSDPIPHMINSLEPQQVANQRCEAVLEQDASNEIALVMLASNHLAQKDDVRCLELIHRLEQLPELSHPEKLYEIRAKLAAFLLNHDEAITFWQQAAIHGYHKGNAELNIATQWILSGDVERARMHIRVAAQYEECRERVEIASARCDMRMLRWSAAIDRLERLEKFKKHRTSAATLLFQCYLSDSRHDCATALCSLLEEEGNPQSHHLRGKLLYRTYNYGRAIECFAESVNLTDHIESKVWLVKSLYAVNDTDSAIAQANLLQLSSSADYLVQGNCWAAAGKLDLAEQRYKKAVRVKGDYAAYSALVNFYFNNRNWGKAYYVLRCANRAGIASNKFESLTETISDAFAISGTIPPSNLILLSHFDFYSTEKMVTCLVDRIIENQPSVEVIDSSKSTHKVVLVIGSLGPGGAERQVVNLANGLVNGAEIQKVDLLCTHLSRKDQDRHYVSQVDARVQIAEYYQRDALLDPADIPGLERYADLLKHIQPMSRQQVILHLAKYLIEIKPDVVHGWLDETLINTSLVCRMLGIRNVVGRWGSMPPGVNRTVSEKDQSNIHYLQHAYNEILRLPGIKFTSNSQLTGNAYAEMMQMPKNQVRIVYNGIDAETLASEVDEVNELRASLGIPDDSKVIGTVFRISEEKRPHLWVDIALKLLEDDPSLHFIMVGTGPMESQIVDYIKSKNAPNIHMVGKQTRVGPWYQLFDVLLLTSRVEGVANVVIESQHCGCPVVAPDVGGLSEAMEDSVTGFLLSDHSVTNFADSVSKLLREDKLRHDLSKNASSYSRNKFSVDGMVTNYKDVFFMA